jgi:hypothetical protein
MLPQATPALISLKVRRTADEIIAMDTSDASAILKATGQSRAREPMVLDHSREIADAQDLLERQCFSFVAFINSIHDASKVQRGIVDRFKTRASLLDTHLENVSDNFLKRIKAMNERIDVLSRTIAPRPIFRRLSPASDFGRITGIGASSSLIALTTASGDAVILNRGTFATEEVHQPFHGESMFCPTFSFRQGRLLLFTVTSGRKLLCLSPGKSPPAQILDVDCFAVTDDAIVSDSFDLAAGEGQSVSFYSIDSDVPGMLKQLGSTKGLRGTVSQIVIDTDGAAVYVLTSRRVLYSISSSTYQVITSMQFQVPLMQLAMTRLFIVISCAPNDVILLERNREKLKEISRLQITEGLRKLFCTSKSIFVITKNQKVERRDLCNPQLGFRICDPEAADYDPVEYIGAVLSTEGELFVAHGNRISLWS